MYPPWITFIGPQTSPSIHGIFWDQYVLPCCGGNAALFVCPAMKSPARWTNLFHANPSYGYNVHGTVGGYRLLGLGLGEPAVPVNRVLMPSEMIAVGDCPGSDAVTIGGLDLNDGEIAFDDEEDFVASRHNGGGNVVFCDAHVEYGKQTNWMRAVDSARQRWNNDHQPHREYWP